MNQQNALEINRLVMRVTDLFSQWQSNPAAFDWNELQTLANEGALAYNEGNGPAFHALVLDGTEHSEFHERFLSYSIESGFDPFKLVHPGVQSSAMPVISHSGLAKAAMSNPVSARMRASLTELARARFEPMLNATKDKEDERTSALYSVFQCCAESIPAELLVQVSPELAKSPQEHETQEPVYPDEGYLSRAESIIESRRPYG